MTGIESISGRIIAITGAGGKTSLLFALQRKFCREGKRVIVTTTTHMLDEKDRPSVIIRSSSFDQLIDTIPKMLDHFGYVVVAEEDPGRNKIRAVTGVTGWITKLSKLCDVLLIEADGARRLPVKAPGPEEPVIPDEADVVLGVIGLSALHRPISEIAFRSEALAGLLGKTVSDPFETEDLLPLILSENGLRKNVRNRRFEVILNQADNLTDKNDLEEVHEIAEKAAKYRIPIHICSLTPCRKLSLILLAAGNSVRYGANKLMTEMPDGRRMYQVMLDMLDDTVNRFRTEEYRYRFRTELSVTVVTQEKYNELAEAAVEKSFRVFFNPAPERGIASSLQTGLSQNLDADACLFTVCDQPSLSAETLETIIRCFLEGGSGIVCASAGGVPGNPCLFSSEFYRELMALSGDRGGKQIVKKHLDKVSLVEVGTEELKDVDYPENREA